MKRGVNGWRGDHPQADRRSIIGTALIAITVLSIGCSAYLGSSGDSRTATFFKDPDSVWDAIEQALIELDYEVVEESRPDGIFRAKSAPAEDGTAVALAIDQVMRTDDQVNVYVRPSFVGDPGSRNPDALKAAANEFVKVLEGKL